LFTTRPQAPVGAPRRISRLFDSASDTGYNADMDVDERGLTIEELAERAGVPVRTVRFYIAERLLPGPGARGREASYGEEHLLRLMLVRRLSERGQRLAKIRAYLDGLTLDEVRALLAEDERDAAALEAAARAPSPRAYVGELLRRARSAREPLKRQIGAALGATAGPPSAPLGATPGTPSAPLGATAGAPSDPPPGAAPMAPGPPPPGSPPTSAPEAGGGEPPQRVPEAGVGEPARRTPQAPAGEPSPPAPSPLSASPAGLPAWSAGGMAPAAAASEPRPPGPGAPGSAAEQWRRIALAPGVELHVRRDARVDPSLVRRLLRTAGLPEDALED
jgi:DNA-binding transcriptional MerR regulator